VCDRTADVRRFLVEERTSAELYDDPLDLNMEPHHTSTLNGE